MPESRVSSVSNVTNEPVSRLNIVLALGELGPPDITPGVTDLRISSMLLFLEELLPLTLWLRL